MSSGLSVRVQADTSRRIEPVGLPVRAVNANAFPHMRYARTVPLLTRGDVAATRRRSVLAQVAAGLDMVVLTPERPFAMWALLDRQGFLPMHDADLWPLTTLLHEMAATLKWNEEERHAGEGVEALLTTVSRPEADLRFAPTEGQWLLRVLVAGNGLQIAAYSDQSAS